MSEFTGQIRQTWARELPRKYDQLRIMNAESDPWFYQKVPLARLGGLISQFVEVTETESIAELVSNKTAVDLSFGKPPVVTSLAHLYEAANQRYGYRNSLTERLVLRMHDPSNECGSGELWFMPAMEVIRYPVDEPES